MIKSFNSSTLRSISKIIGEEILTNKQISEQFHNSGLIDTNEGMFIPVELCTRIPVEKCTS